MIKTIYIPLICLTAILFADASLATEISILPKRERFLSAENLFYSQMLHTGSQNDSLYVRGRFGVDYGITGITLDTLHYYDLGISASVKINMLPRRMIFAVDNFYAVLAIHFSSKLNDMISWRLYPVYHLSAHLADGHKDDIIKSETHAVSSEMLRAEVFIKCFRYFEIAPAYGWYYHITRALRGLSQRADLSILFNKKIFSNIEATVLLKGEMVQHDVWLGGFDGMAGIRFVNNGQGLGLFYRYFNRPHKSYYVKEYENGWGIELLFF